MRPDRRLISLALSLGIALALPAQDADSTAATSLVGTWNGSTTTIAGKSEWQLVVSEDMTGVIEGESFKGTASQIQLKDDKLSFLLSLADKVELSFSGKLSEDGFKGMLNLPGLGEIARVSAEKAPEVDLSALVGKWKMESQSEMGNRSSSMVIKADGSGKADFGEFGNFPLDYLDLQGDVLTWGVAGDFGGQQVYIEFEGKLEGTRFSGSLWVGEMEIASLTGTKQ